MTEAAWCAHDQDGFFEYQHILYENQEQLAVNASSGTLSDLATRVDLDGDALGACLSSGTHQAGIANSRQAASNRGINSTPTFFINGQKVEGNLPYERIKQMLDQIIAAAQ